MPGNFNACVHPVLAGPIVFQCLQHFTTSKSSTGILWYVTFDIDFFRRRMTCVLWGVSHMTQHRLYLQCSLVNKCLCSSFETSRRFLRGAFSLAKRNDIRQGLAASHVNSHWLVNPRRIVPEKTQWKWTRGMRPDSCDARFLFEKKQGMWGRSAGSHLNLQSHWTQDVFYSRKHTESGRVSATHVSGSGWSRVIWIYSHRERKTHFTWDNTRHLGGWSTHFSLKNTTRGAGGSSVVFKLTVKMKARRI